MNEQFSLVIYALSLSLLHFLWQGVLIGALTALVLSRLKNNRAQLRYALACAALLCCLLVPVGTLIGALMPAVMDAPALQVAVSGLANASGTSFDAELAMNTAPMPGLALRFAPWLVAVWAAGAGFMFLRMTKALSLIKRLHLLPPAPQEWQTRFDDLAARFALGSITLRIQDGLGSPISAGFLYPMVLMPAGLLTRLPVAQIEALLAHELAHIRRHDYLFNLLQVVIETLLFYHPAVWWLSKQIRIEREQIADQMAAELIGTPKPLAQALAALAEWSSPDHLTLALAASGGALEMRIKRLFLSRGVARAPVRKAVATLLIAFGLTLGTFGLFACTQVSQINHHRAKYLSPQQTSKADRLSFALVRFDREVILAYGPDDEIDQVARALPPRNVDYLLLRRNGRDALVVDASVVAPMRQAWEHAENLEGLVNQNDAPPERDALLRHLLREQNLAYQEVERLLLQSVANAPVVPL